MIPNLVVLVLRYCGKCLFTSCVTAVINVIILVTDSSLLHTVFLRLLDGVFSFQNNPKNLDLSYKTDLDLKDCLGRVKLVLQQNFIGLI